MKKIAIFFSLVCIAIMAGDTYEQKIVDHKNVAIFLDTGYLVTDKDPVFIPGLTSLFKEKCCSIIMSGSMFHSFLSNIPRSYILNEMRKGEDQIYLLNNQIERLRQEGSDNDQLQEKIREKDDYEKTDKVLLELCIEFAKLFNKVDKEEQEKKLLSQAQENIKTKLTYVEKLTDIPTRSEFFKFSEWKVYKYKDNEAALYIAIPVGMLDMESNFNLDKLELIKSETDLKESLKFWDKGYGKIEKIVTYVRAALPGYRSPLQVDLGALQDCFAKGSGNWNILLFGHGAPQHLHHVPLPKYFQTPGHIAGLRMIQFLRFLGFCSQDIKTNSLYIFSCYCGVAPMSWVNEKMKIIEQEGGKSFIIGTKSSFDLETSVLTKFNWPEYFNNISNFRLSNFYQNSINTSNFQENIELNDLLKNVYGQIIDKPSRRSLDREGISNMPLVRLPYWDSFIPVSLYHDILLLDEKNGEAQTNNNDVVLLSGSRLKRLDINNPVEAILSINPGPSEIELDQLNAQCMDLKALAESFSKLLTIYRSCLKVKHLRLKDSELSDVLIYRSPGISKIGFPIQMNVQILGKDSSNRSLSYSLNYSKFAYVDYYYAPSDRYEKKTDKFEFLSDLQRQKKADRILSVLNAFKQPVYGFEFRRAKQIAAASSSVDALASTQQ